MQGFNALHPRAGYYAADLTGRGEMPAFDPSKINWVEIMSEHIVTKRLLAAFLTCLVYEMIITTDDCINLFWRHRWSISKVLYLLNRYNSVLLMIALAFSLFQPSASQAFCNATPWIQLIGATILISVINLSMVARVYALWNRSPIVLGLALAAFFLNLGSYIVIFSYAYAIGFIQPNVLPLTGCFAIPGYDKAYMPFVTSIVFETIIIIFTLIKSYPIVRQRGIKTPLYTLLLEDGLVYYGFIILSQIIIIVAAFNISVSLSEPILGSYPSIAISGIACNRLLLRPQRLLLSGGSRLPSEFRSDDLRTASITLGSSKRREETGTQLSYLSRDLPGERLELDERRRSTNWGTGSRLSKKRPSVLFVNGIILPEPSQPISPSSHQLTASLDNEIDLTGHGQYLQGITVEREDVHRIDGKEVATEDVIVPSDGPFSYGSRMNVLDSSAVMIPDTGALRVSRVGRYD